MELMEREKARLGPSCELYGIGEDAVDRVIDGVPTRPVERPRLPRPILADGTAQGLDRVACDKVELVRAHLDIVANLGSRRSTLSPKCVWIAATIGSTVAGAGGLPTVSVGGNV